MKHNVPVQSLIDHIKTAVDVDPWAKEMVEELLKEQEPVEVITTYSVNGFKHWYCSNCPSELPIGANYCSNCGRRLKWHG